MADEEIGGGKTNQMVQETMKTEIFHVANIQNLLTKTETGEKGMFMRKMEKMDFLRDQSKEEEPLFLAYCETGLTKRILEAEFSIDGYTHVASHRENRCGGGVIIYIRKDVPYKILTTVSDEMCSMVAIHLEKLNIIVFMVYRPPPSYKSKYHGGMLEKSFKDIVIKNIHKEMNKFKAPTPDIILAGDFNFPKAQWNAGIGTIKSDCLCNRNSLQELLMVASHYNLLQMVTEGTRETRSGESNILELIFTNNHDLITNVQVQPSEITDHKYIVCETSHKLPTKGKEHIPVDEVNLSSYNYETADWVNIKASLKKINWPDVLAKCKSSEEKLKVIVDIVIKIVEIHCSIFESKGETHSHIIPRYRRILLRKKKKLYKKLRNTNSADKKVELENYIREIDKKLLESHEEENIVKETQALEKIKTNPKHFFTYAKKEAQDQK